jgi:Leucine-rich repeat (LRR) protein
MPSLDTLLADGNDIVDLSPLRGLAFLRILNFSGNSRLSDLTPASDSLYAVHVLDLSGTSVKDLTPLEGHSSLSDLDVSNLGLDSLAARPVLPDLLRLNLAYNELTDISKLEGFTTLSVLLLDHAPITDIAPLVRNSALDEGSEVSLLGTSVNWRRDSARRRRDSTRRRRDSASKPSASLPKP